MRSRKVLPAILMDSSFLPEFYNFDIEIDITHEKSKTAIEVLSKNGLNLEGGKADDFQQGLFLFLSKKPKDFAEGKIDVVKNFYESIGLEVHINSYRFNGQSIIVNVRALHRVQLLDVVKEDPFYLVRAEYIYEYGLDTKKTESLIDQIESLLDKMQSYSIWDKDNIHISNFIEGKEERDNMIAFADGVIFNHIFEADQILSFEDFVSLFTQLDLSARLEAAYKIISFYVVDYETNKCIDQRSQELMQYHQRQVTLQKRKAAIENELDSLNDDGTGLSDIESLEVLIDVSGMSSEAEKIARAELAKLKRMSSMNSEAIVSRVYIEHLCEYPWDVEAEESFNVSKAREILERDHFGLELVKKRILEYLAVRQLKPDKRSEVVCYNGPPGTGKTSIVKSIGEAIGRPIFRISLGGVSDIAELKGHRRTYIGALPGKIALAMIRTGVKNPIIHFDEIDKLRSDARGDPAAVLLAIMDPEQNSTFSDDYFGTGVELDLSKVMFICTSNYKENIPSTLRDRLNIIDFSGYTHKEKLEIAKKHLIPKQIKENGLSNLEVTISDEALLRIITEYTREAGVRELERKIADVLRGAFVVPFVQNSLDSLDLKEDDVETVLGAPLYKRDQLIKDIVPGVISGLAWTMYGGCILPLEILKIPKSDKKSPRNLIITGNLGDVMKESVEVAFTCAITYLEKLGLSATEIIDFIYGYDYHIHFPENAIPKDGPSAGVAITLGLLSSILNKKVSNIFALTGEITTKGKVKGIGGLKEKLLVAYNAGYKNIFIPEVNKKDLVLVPEEVRDGLNIMLTERIEDIVEYCFKQGP